MRLCLGVTMLVLAGCGRIGFGLADGDDTPPTDAAVTDGAPSDGTTDAMMSMTGLDNTSTGSSDGTGVTIASSPAAHASGRLLVVAIHWIGNTAAVVNVSDSAGNFYQPLDRSNHPNGGSVQLWFTNNTPFGNANNVVTAAFTGLTTKRRILVHEYPAVDSQTGQGNGFGSGGSAVSSSVGAPADALVVASCFTPNGSSTTFTPGAGFALAATAGTDSQTEDRLVTGGTTNATMTYTPAANNIIAFVVFDR